MTEETKELVKHVEPTPGTYVDRSPAALMIMAIQNNLDLDKVEKAMALQQRYEANEARKAYHDAMAAFKANPPEIEKDQTVKYTAGNKVVEYRHASLANVTGKINAALSVHGLSAAWNVSQAEKQITVTCTVTHRLGHSESTSLHALPDDSGSKNAIQAVGSTISYLERYTLLALTGLATHEMDDDAQGEPEYINEAQITEMNNLITETKANLNLFLKHFGADSVEKFPATKYITALQELQRKKNKVAKQPERQPGEDDE